MSILWWAGMFPDGLRNFSMGFPCAIAPMEQLVTLTVAKG